MSKKIKLISGGIYLVHFGKHFDPELNSPHYCVVIKTNDPGLILCLPTTSKPKLTEKYRYELKEDNSVCLFKHAKIVSKNRVLNILKDSDNEQKVLSNNEYKNLLNSYINYLNVIFRNSIRGNEEYNQIKIQSNSVLT